MSQHRGAQGTDFGNPEEQTLEPGEVVVQGTGDTAKMDF